MEAERGRGRGGRARGTRGGWGRGGGGGGAALAYSRHNGTSSATASQERHGGGSEGARRGRGGGRGRRAAKRGGPQRVGWQLELLQIVRHPDESESDGVVFLRETFETEVPVQVDAGGAPSSTRKGKRREEVIVIYDKMPKARRHLLALPLQEIDGPESLKRFHLPVLDALHAAGRKTIAKLQAEHPTLTFRMGFHAVPTLRQLHLHIISQDFETRHMNRDLRWNSFTTPFFVDIVEMIRIVERDGKFRGESYRQYLKQPIECIRCHLKPSSFEELKEHIAVCLCPEAS